jgi:hypothetical protein
MIIKAQERRLLLISRDDILGASERQGQHIYRLLAWFGRHGYHLLATAPQADRWLPDSKTVDNALLGPQSIRSQLNDAGGNLDGVYYVRKSLLTQRRNREEALKDILDRYAMKSKYCYLLSGSGKFVQAALGLGIRATHLTRDMPLETILMAMKEQSPDS